MKWDAANLIAQVRTVCEITPEGCWLWRHESWAERDLTGVTEYPRLMIAGRRLHVSVWVLTAKAGAAAGMEPCHSCDRPPCVCPDHLRWGTHRENMQEMGARKRTGPDRHPERYPRGRVFPNRVRGEDHWMRKDPERAAQVMAARVHGSVTHPERFARGDALPWTKLTASQIPAIRQRLAAGEKPTAIAPDYGVGRGTIRAIDEGRTWKHVA